MQKLSDCFSSQSTGRTSFSSSLTLMSLQCTKKPACHRDRAQSHQACCSFSKRPPSCRHKIHQAAAQLAQLYYTGWPGTAPDFQKSADCYFLELQPRKPKE